MDIKIGDKLAVIKYDVSSWNSSQYVNWGYVFYVDEKKIGIARYQMSPIYIHINSNTEEFYLVNNKTKTYMYEIIDANIEGFKKQIRKLTSEEKDVLATNEFNRIKQQITKTAQNMIEDIDESNYINRLKEICKLKDSLFKIKISDLDSIHKKNGSIKMKIRSLQELRNKVDNIVFEENLEW